MPTQEHRAVAIGLNHSTIFNSLSNFNLKNKAMKVKSILLLGVLFLGLMVTFFSCKEKDDYDYNSIEPAIFAITGPGEVAAHGISEFPYTYRVTHRGGSSFNWVVTGHGGTVVLDEEYPSIAYITFNQSSDTTAAIITVTETTAGGKASEPFSRTIVLTPFCPYDMNLLAGEWSGTSSANDPILYATTTGKLNELRIKGLAGFVNFSWGENWTSGDGSCILVFSCGGVIAINNQWIGDTDYPDRYRIQGSGLYDEVAGTITLSYTVYYSDGGGTAGNFTTVLTKN